MPMYDRLCACGWTKADSLERIADTFKTCPECGAETVRGRLQGGSVNIVGDEIPGGFTDDNLGPEPITYYSKSERKRLMKERGLSEAVRHVGYDGSDKSAHTIRWDSGPPPGVDMRPWAMLNAEERIARHQEWLNGEPEPTLRSVTLYPPEPESGFSESDMADLSALAARVL